MIAEAPTTEDLTERLYSEAVRHILSVGPESVMEIPVN